MIKNKVQDNMKNKRCFIIHGWEGVPTSNWFPWLKRELEKVNFAVKVPAMPDTKTPEFKKWLVHIQKIIVAPDKNTYLVGHSLGVITILRYLESLPAKARIGGAILVAGFPEPIGYNEIKSFFKTRLNYRKIRLTTSNFVAIHSDNDPFVSVKNGKILKKRLGSKLIIVPKAGHFNADDGFTQLPIVLDALLNISENLK